MYIYSCDRWPPFPAQIRQPCRWLRIRLRPVVYRGLHALQREMIRDARTYYPGAGDEHPWLLVFTMCRPPVLDEEVAIGGATMPRGREQQEKRRWVVLAGTSGRGWIRWQTLVDEAAARLLAHRRSPQNTYNRLSLSLSRAWNKVIIRITTPCNGSVYIKYCMTGCSGLASPGKKSAPRAPAFFCYCCHAICCTSYSTCKNERV